MHANRFDRQPRGTTEALLSPRFDLSLSMNLIISSITNPHNCHTGKLLGLRMNLL